MIDKKFIYNAVRSVQNAVVKSVIDARNKTDADDLQQVAFDNPEDTIYQIDKATESQLLEWINKEFGEQFPIVLIAEGINEGKALCIPSYVKPDECKYRMIIDPIDGTRGIMYDKRSAWVLAGIAENKGNETTLADIVFAMQTEIPLIKQRDMDIFWAWKDEEKAHGLRVNTDTYIEKQIEIKPSNSDSLAHGFVNVSRFFPGAKVELSKFEEEFIRELLGPVKPGKAHCFEDQYISTGGQIAELISGHDRLVIDIRPLVEPVIAKKGEALGLCCHPYDLCTELIARKSGVIITDQNGKQVNYPLDTATDCSWIGYANKTLYKNVEHVLKRTLKNQNLS